MVLFLSGVAVMQAQQARVVFYNVENLFDTEDDPHTRDEEFLPEGERHWTQERMVRKTVETLPHFHSGQT